MERTGQQNCVGSTYSTRRCLHGESQISGTNIPPVCTGPVKSEDQERIAELERLVGRLSLQLDIAESLSHLELTVQQKRTVVEMVAHDYPVSYICEVLDYIRSCYYQKARVADDEELEHAIEAEVAKFPTYGYRRITHDLRRQGWTSNHKRVERIMHERGWQARRKRRHQQTTDSAHPFLRYPNLVEHLEIVSPEQVWVSDITYIGLPRSLSTWPADGCLHAGHSRLAPGRSLDQSLTLRALEKVLASHTPEIHQSDQWVQYVAIAYTARLQAASVHISMAEVGAA